MINRAVERIAGVDLFEALFEVVGGDWVAWGRCADVWRRVGGTFALVAHEVWRGNARLDGGWYGNAADAAYEHFHRIAFVLKGIAPHYVGLSKLYQLSAAHAYKAADLIGSQLRSLTDSGIVALLTATPTGATPPNSHVVRTVKDTVGNVGKLIAGYQVIFDGIFQTATADLAAMTTIESGLPAPYSMPAEYGKVDKS